MNVECYKCNEKLTFDHNNQIRRSEECPKCYAQLRCCQMCLFYDSKSYNECRESVAERIVDKEKSNFCDFFKLNTSEKEFQEMQNSTHLAAEALFKKG